jgi:hypothetical protein
MPGVCWILDAQHGFHRTDDHLQKSGHIPMMCAYHVSGAIADRMTLLENYAQNIETEKTQIKEDHLKMQTHTMRYNLIFGGIEQTALDYEEDTNFRVHFLGSFYIFNFLINVCYTFLDFIKPFINFLVKF